MLVGLHVPTNFLICRQTLTLSKCMCMRASELRKFWHFYILNLLFLSIFCRYIRYFVGTNDMLVGSHVPTNFQMYRQKSEKALLGGGGSCPPPPPLATLMRRQYYWDDPLIKTDIPLTGIHWLRALTALTEQFCQELHGLPFLSSWYQGYQKGLNSSKLSSALCIDTRYELVFL